MASPTTIVAAPIDLDRPEATILAIHRGAYPAGERGRVLIIHTGETPESERAAEGIGNYFASGQTIGSAHAGVDTEPGWIRYANIGDRCNGAAGANDFTHHLELAGRAGQTSGDWEDATSRLILANAAGYVRAHCTRHRIRPVLLGATDLRTARDNSSYTGIAGHDTVSDAFGATDHYDPGAAFPWPTFLAAIQPTDPTEAHRMGFALAKLLPGSGAVIPGARAPRRPFVALEHLGTNRYRLVGFNGADLRKDTTGYGLSVRDITLTAAPIALDTIPGGIVILCADGTTPDYIATNTR